MALEICHIDVHLDTRAVTHRYPVPIGRPRHVCHAKLYRTASQSDLARHAVIRQLEVSVEAEFLPELSGSLNVC